MTDFARELTEKIAPLLPTASMGCIVGGGRMQPMYYYLDDESKKEHTQEELWEALTDEDKDRFRDIAYCCFYHMGSFSYEQVFYESMLEYMEREGK